MNVKRTIELSKTAFDFAMRFHGETSKAAVVVEMELAFKAAGHQEADFNMWEGYAREYLMQLRTRATQITPSEQAERQKK